MFILDSLMISGLRWVLTTIAAAAEAEMDDQAVLRERLVEAEMRRDTGEISEEEFRAIEADLLARMRQVRQRHEGAAAPLACGRSAGKRGVGLQVEAGIAGDFHEGAPGSPQAGAAAPAVAPAPPSKRRDRRRAASGASRGNG